MKQTINSSVVASLLIGFLWCAENLAAQTFIGTNAPGQATNYSFTIGAATTNLSLVISNAPATYSYLRLAKGRTPTDTDFDFISRLNGATNQINLQSPEFSATNYGLRVSTPAGSAPHAFTVLLTTNRTDVRTSAYPVLKPLAFTTTGVLTNAPGLDAFHYFQVDMPTNLPGWRIVLSTTNAGANLYVRRGAIPTTGSYDYLSSGQLVDTAILDSTMATSNTYFLGVYLPAGPATNCNYTLTTEIGWLTTLGWDPGTVDGGTQVYTNVSASGGDYFFKIATQNTANGAWRTALKVTGGEANLYLRQGAAAQTNSYTYASTRVGSDGFVLPQVAQWSPGQDWYLTVHATPGAQWTLMTGEPYVEQLPALAADASSGTNGVIGPEGMRFFKTTISAGTLAWRLGLNGDNNTLLVDGARAPVLYGSAGGGYYDWSGNGQLLLVPNYINVGNQYIVGVIGNPGQSITLDSRQQAVTDLAFNSVTNVSATTFGYVTFRVQVPVQQIAWQVNLSPTSGDPNVAVRQDNVPNEYTNDAFSEISGSIGDSITMVPPVLSDGTFYVTVYGTPPFSCAMTNGQPIITDVHYVFQITNDAPARTGWRFYRVVNTAEQLGTYGWDLELANQLPGTEIALRRNAVPSRWNYRNCTANCNYNYARAYLDYSGTGGFLQRPGHQADIWYIGVYQPTNALGSFVLSGSELTAAPVSFDGVGSSLAITNQAANKWQYFVFDVPANAFGWDLRLIDATNGNPYMYVCRDQLPSQSNPYGWNPQYSATWPSGYQWQAGYDWTGDYYDNNGVYRYSQVLQMGMGNPLQPGTYYVGVISSTGVNPISYTLVSRGIGTNMSIPIVSLPFTNGVVTTNLVGREVAYYSIVVPTNLPSWRLKLGTNTGESLLMLEKDALPNVAAGGYAPTYLYGGRKMQKVGNEQYLMMPTYNQSNIVAGTYYLAVASEGMNPSYPYLGTNSSSFTLTSYGALSVSNIGIVDNTGLTDIMVTNSVEAGQLSAFQFTVPPNTLSLEVHLENRVGNPTMLLRADNQLTGGSDSYGVDGGQGSTWSSATLINIANPTATNYTLMVQALASGGDASYRIRIHALGPLPVAFDGGSSSITNQVAGIWQYFVINVPANAFGWDLRITGATNGNPNMYVCRDQSPSQSNPYGWNPPYSTTWPSGYQWQAGYDWTGDYYDNNSVYRYSQVLQMGTGNPLQPGTYYVGVISSTGVNPISYTLVSRGIGTNMSIPIVSLPFTNGVVTNLSLNGREAAYYTVVVPTNVPNWKLRLANVSGETLIAAQKDALPNVSAGGYAPTYLYGGRKMQKAGNEQYLLLPVSGQSNIVAGTYYLLVASEGINPSPPYLGTNSSSFVLTSQGSLVYSNVGTITTSETARTNSLEAGEIKVWQFTAPAAVYALEVRLTDKIGNSYMHLALNSNAPSGQYGYGYDNGVSAPWGHDRIINIPNPSSGLYSLNVQADPATDASYALRVRLLTPTDLAFDRTLSTPSLTNVYSGALSDLQHGYFRVTVPAAFNGQPVLGWKLTLEHTQGNPRLRVRKDAVPDDNYYVGDSPWNYEQMAIVPPYLTPGTWYVDVQGQGTSQFTLTSSALLLERPAWAMPAIGGSVTTPGLPAGGPVFGDTGIGTNGVALPGDQGIDLEQGRFHYYAVVVPSNNIGILRTRLDAISGDPNLYLRVGNPPTLSHYQNGDYGNSMSERSLTANVGSEYGNWVPLSGRDELQLTPGTWYLAVQAGGNSNVRYRLLSSLGVVADLTYNGVALVNQTLAAGDWRYYRVFVPNNAFTSWNVTFAQTLGDVVMYVRDITPPGQGSTVSDYRHWQPDNKNFGPYPIVDPPGTTSLPCPPLRPGSFYYLGFRAVNDATFSVSSTTNITAINYTNTIAFYSGGVTNVIPANGVLKYRIDVPADARRWIHTSTHSNTVWLYLEQGTIPNPPSEYHWSSGAAANSTLNQQLYSSYWPWLPAYSYFLLVTNTTALPQDFVFNMNGRNSATDDYDGDGLADSWELTYWPSIYSFNGTSDPDSDGVSNAEEYTEGSTPTNSASFNPRLLVNSNNGIVTRNPVGNSTLTPPKVWYAPGTSVDLAPTADPGYSFIGWSGDASGAGSPYNLVMNAHKTVTAIFGITNNSGADYQFQLSLASAVGAPPNLQDIGVGNSYITEAVDTCSRLVRQFPLHNGLHLQPTSGVIPTNIYTIVMLFRLDQTNGWRRLLDFKAAAIDTGLYVRDGRLNFYPVIEAAAPTIPAGAYVQVVLTRDSASNVVAYVNGVQQLSFVDTGLRGVLTGANDLRFFKDDTTEESGGAVARIRLYAAAMPAGQVALLDRTDCAGVPRFLTPYFYTNALQLPVTNVIPAIAYRLLATTNLSGWTSIATNTPATSGTLFVDPQATNFIQRYYRVVTP